MNKDFERLGFSPADIMVPQNCELSKWSVVACDQYTSQPEYWARVAQRVGDAPSALHLILPESCLEGPDVEQDISEINLTMARYLKEGRLRTYPDALFYVERRLSGGKVRRGLVGKVDLEQYDYEPGSSALIRATEGTVLSRIPPRVAVRKNAPIELPHVMLLADDPGRTVIEPLAAQTREMEQVYDFELMEQGGHITGWKLTGVQMDGVCAALAALANPAAFAARYGAGEKSVLLFAVGDGNHSLATAKECYERQKKLTPPEQWPDLPARYALWSWSTSTTSLWSLSPSTGWYSAWSRSSCSSACWRPIPVPTTAPGRATAWSMYTPGGRGASPCQTPPPSCPWAPCRLSWMRI